MLLIGLAASLQLLPFSAAAKEVVLPQGHGPYKVSLEVKELVDSSRLDPWNSSHVRRIMISRFEPKMFHECNKQVKVPYFPKAILEAESIILASFGFPTSFWSDFNFKLKVCGPPMKQSSTYPVALFSPALNTTRLFHSVLAQELASYGFTVITMDHPYDTDIVQFPDGSIIYGGSVEPPRDWPNGSDASVIKALDVRADDASFVLNSFDVKQAVIFGQSFGGAATATAIHKDARFKGGVNVDGAMFGPVVGDGFRRPNRSFLIWGTENETAEKLYETFDFFWASLGRRNSTWRREMTMTNLTHASSTWDLGNLVDAADYRAQLDDALTEAVGALPGPHVYERLGRTIQAYFKFALGIEEQDPILDHPETVFPDVRIVRQ